MEELKIFQNPEFGAIRTIRDDKGEPLFCAKDVCEALGYKKARNAIAQHVDEGDALKQGLIDSLGREQFTTFINESGLYTLILGSKLESARRGQALGDGRGAALDTQAGRVFFGKANF